jgi:hypothetical protein
MRPLHYATCTVCKITKPKVKEFAHKQARSIYLDVCRACYVPFILRMPRVLPVPVETPGIKTRWVKEFYVPAV